MSTNSRIGVLLPGGNVRSIYCHWDGYPENQLPILKKHFFRKGKITQLMNLGDISYLAPKIGKQHDWNNQDDDIITAYGRDRGEEGTEAMLSLDIEEFMEDPEHHMYLWNGKRWLVDEEITSFAKAKP